MMDRVIILITPQQRHHRIEPRSCLIDRRGLHSLLFSVRVMHRPSEEGDQHGVANKLSHQQREQRHTRISAKEQHHEARQDNGNELTPDRDLFCVGEMLKGSRE